MNKFITKTLITLSMLGFGATTYADIDSFDIQVNPKTTKVGETINLTIRALNKDGNTFEDYTGSVLIFSQDDNAEFPGALSDNIYDFTLSDGGVVTFENAVRFSQEGIQDINVYDLENENVFGYVEVEVTSDEIAREESITIISPSSGTTIPNSEVKISGETASNHLISIIINGNREENVISNSNGLFELNITELEDGENTIIANVLDDNEQVIGTSQEVMINIQASAPRFNGVVLEGFEDRDGVYNDEEVLELEVRATQELENVTARVNGVQFSLNELENGVYTGNITTPLDNGDYTIDIVLVNNLGIETKENGVLEFSVIKQEETLEEEPVTEEIIELESAPEQVSCEELKEGLNIENINLNKLRTKSILSWNEVEKATSYNVYKKDSNEKMIFVKNVKDPRIEIAITGDEVKHEEFAVKAFAENDECEVESASFSEMTKVQTGPELIALLLISLMGGFLFLKYSRKNS